MTNNLVVATNGHIDLVETQGLLYVVCSQCKARVMWAGYRKGWDCIESHLKDKFQPSKGMYTRNHLAISRGKVVRENRFTFEEWVIDWLGYPEGDVSVEII